MTHTVIATCNFKSLKDKNTFLEILHGDDGLVKTRNWSGCILIECYITNDNDKQVVLWEKWDKQSDHESYMAMRKESGLFDLLETLLESPLEVSRLTKEDC